MKDHRSLGLKSGTLFMSVTFFWTITYVAAVWFRDLFALGFFATDDSLVTYSEENALTPDL